jgi:hypothetical protein
MITRPVAVGLAGLAALVVVALDAIPAKRRNIVPRTYAEVEHLKNTTTLASSERLFELTVMVPLDEVSPDSLASNIAGLMKTLLEVSTNRGVGLDWVTFRFHIFEYPKTNDAQLIARVDVLQ